MGSKKKARPASRDAAPADTTPRATVEPTGEVAERPRGVPERIREQNPGFTVLKIIGGVLIALVLLAALAPKLLGGRRSDTSTRAEIGDRCEARGDCRPGSLCVSYQGAPKICRRKCGPDSPCPPSETCTSAEDRYGRKSLRVVSYCIPN